jgi:predicted MPP superfamily phosphohydrolase
MTETVSRRRFVRTALAAAAGAPILTVLHTWLVEPHWLEIVHRDLPLEHLPVDLQGRTLVHLSDLHIGPTVDDDYIIRTFQRVAALRPAFVVVGGDLITYHSDEQFDQLQRVVSYLPHGTLGTVATLGNHDYGRAWSHPEVADRVAAIATRAGALVLRNTSAILSGLQLVGLDDLWARRFVPERALTGLDRKTATVVLSHNPDTVDLPAWGGYRGWILAGHTHGGQCKPPFLPPPLLPVRNRRYTCGEFDLPGGRRMYISRGVGHLLKVRFNVRPEVTVFRLRAA